MVKHIILWKLRPEYNNSKIKNDVKSNLEALKGIIPGLIEISVQTDCLESSNADIMLYSEFESISDLNSYAVHPAHVKAADTFVRPFTETRMCMDFEV